MNLSNKGGILLLCYLVFLCGLFFLVFLDWGIFLCMLWDLDNGYIENLNIDVILLIWLEVDFFWIFSIGNKK